jgi:hypothetical protein
MTRQRLCHIRTKDKNGNINSKGGITFSGIVDDQNKVIRFATAYCHSKDNYNRKTGKVKATSRMQSETYCFELGDMDMTVALDWNTMVEKLAIDAEKMRKSHIISEIAKLEAKKEGLRRRIAKLTLEL